MTTLLALAQSRSFYVTIIDKSLTMNHDVPYFVRLEKFSWRT